MGSGGIKMLYYLGINEGECLLIRLVLHAGNQLGSTIFVKQQ